MCSQKSHKCHVNLPPALTVIVERQNRSRDVLGYYSEMLQTFWSTSALEVLLLGRFFWFLLLALLVFALVRRFRRRNWPVAFSRSVSFSSPGTSPARFSALEILRQRYARGEIDAVTFDQMRERQEKTRRS